MGQFRTTGTNGGATAVRPRWRCHRHGGNVPRFPEEIDPGTGSREKSAATEGWQIQFHQTLEAGNSHGTIVYLPT